MADTEEVVDSRIDFESDAVDEVIEETPEVVEPEESVEPVETPEPEEDETVVSFGEEAAPASQEQDNSVIRELRATIREQAKKLKEIEVKPAEAAKPKLGDKPTLEACDYDEEAFETQLTSWYERKRELEALERQAEEEQRKQQEAHQQRLTAYQERATALKVKDFKAAEEEVVQTFSEAQQAILWGADDTAALVYALGKHPEKLKELASIKDPAKFAFAAAKLETQMKVTTRKPKTQPETRVAPGAGSLSGGSDATLERLRAEAEKTGDYSKVGAYRRAQKAKQS